MKYIISLIILCFITSLQAQDDIPKKANLITLTNELSKDDNFAMATRQLFEGGFGILSSNKESGMISTTDKPFKNGIIKLNLLISDGQISIRGNFMDNVSLDLGGMTVEPSWSPIENTGAKNSVYQNAWNEAMKFAITLEGEKQYLIK